MDKVCELHTPTGVYVEMREFERVCRERDEAKQDAEDQRALVIGYRVKAAARKAECDRLEAERDEARAALTAKLPRILSECKRWKQEFRSAWLGLVECRRERDEARAEYEALRLELYSKPLEYNALAEQLDEARAALREMVDAAHTSFTLPYPLAKEMRVRFEWLRE